MVSLSNHERVLRQAQDERVKIDRTDFEKALVRSTGGLTSIGAVDIIARPRNSGADATGRMHRFRPPVIGFGV